MSATTLHLLCKCTIFVILALAYLEKIKFALLLGLNIERVAKVQPNNLSLRRCN